MRKMVTILLSVVLAVSCTMTAWAVAPATGEDVWITPVLEKERSADTSKAYSDADLNTITNVVNGEVGGIVGTVVLTYADGSQFYTDGRTLRMIHARIVDNQVKSSLFPSTVQGCVSQCWSLSYTGTDLRSSAQWQSCRQAVVDALNGGISIPSNVYAATCDPNFASYAGWYLWARVDWDTGWYSGVFYYYAYGG